VKRLLQVLQRIVSHGDTVLVIEHNLDVIKLADWIIDIGPEGGKKGGQILSIGTPEEVAKSKKGYTPRFLKLKLC
jgi:excinuclease ABC subunit A